MPIVRIDIQSGKTTTFKRSVLHSVREAIVEALGVPDERVMQRIVETPAEDIDAAQARTDHLTIIEISMISGRDAELKGRLFDTIAKKVSFSPGLDVTDLVMIVHDPAAECFYLDGSQCGHTPAAKSVPVTQAGTAFTLEGMSE